VISSLEEIGERIWRFLEEALTERKPDRDIPVSEGILRDLVDTLSAGGFDEEHWKAGRRTVILRSVRALAGQPERWNEAAKLAAIYLSSDWRPEHPLADLSRSRWQVGPDHQPVHPIPVDLQLPLLKELVAFAKSDERVRFLQSIADLGVCRGLLKLLPDLDLGGEEMVALLIRIAEFFRDGPLSALLQAMIQWAQQHPTKARSIVDRWLDKTPVEARLSIAVVETLIDGIIAGSNDHIWRDHIIDRLDERATEEAWQLAAFVACFAWPEQERKDVCKRHEALVARIKKLPELMVWTGIRALARDAREFPLETLETALRLYNLLPASVGGEQRVAAAVALLDTAYRAAFAAKDKVISQRPFLQVLDHMLVVPPDRDVSLLDAFLDEFAGEAEPEVRKFVQAWLARHAMAIEGGGKSLRELFPLIVNRNPDRADGWLVEWMIASSPDLRRIAAALLGRRRTAALPQAEIASLSETQVKAIAYVLAGGGMLIGNIWVPALVELGRARPDLLDLIQKLLLEDAADQYPGILRHAIRRWDGEEPWSAAARTITGHLDARQKAWRRKGEVPELTICPAFTTWQERQRQTMEEEFRRAEKDFVFLRIAVKIPMARGEASNWSGDPSEQTPFRQYETSREFPALDVVDPVEAELRRLQRRREAERLIAQADAEKHARPSG
jgi:hypothetical protein